MSRRRGQSNVYFAIFNNVFDTGQSLSEIYDLKVHTFSSLYFILFSGIKYSLL